MYSMIKKLFPISRRRKNSIQGVQDGFVGKYTNLVAIGNFFVTVTKWSSWLVSAIPKLVHRYLEL